MISAGKRYPGKVAGSDVIPPACPSHFVSARDYEVDCESVGVVGRV
jgi:hypothetical protein